MPGSLFLGHAVTNCVLVPQVNQAAARDDDGAKAETDETGATAEVTRVTWSIEPVDRGEIGVF